MKMQIALLATFLLAGCAQPDSNAEKNAAPDTAPSQRAQVDTTTGDRSTEEKPADEAASMGMDAKDHAAMGAAGGDAKADAGASAQPQGTGVVKSIDAAAGKVTIAHGPIAALNWPAMTMAFSASPQLLAAAKEGQRVRFEFTQGEGGSTLTVLEAAR